MKIVIFNPESKHDYLAESIQEGLKKNNIETIPLHTSNGWIKSCANEELVKQAKDCDYIFVIWGKLPKGEQEKLPYGVKGGHLLDIINRWDKVIYIDGSEWSWTAHRSPGQSLNDRRSNPWLNAGMFNKAAHYLKRECYQEDIQMGIKPLLFSAFERNFQNQDLKKDIDLFVCFGQTRTGMRKEVENFCRQLERERPEFNIIIENELPFETYKQCISRSRITVDAWGAGDCNARLFEIPANKSVLLYQEYQIGFPYKFEEGVEAVSYNDMKSFRKKLMWLLEDQLSSYKISMAGYEHLIKYHTTEKRIQQLLNIIQ